MNALTRWTLALAAGAVALPVFAAAPVKLSPDAAAAHASAGAPVVARIVQAKNAKATAAVDSTLPGPRTANAFRSYPPSCAADPLPTDPANNTFVWNGQMSLYTRDSAGNAYTPEVVNVYLWRLACSSSGALTPYNVDHGNNAILLMRIDRSSTSTDIFPTFPYITSSQNSNASAVRAAAEPNTVISEAPYDSPILASSTVYVLENYPFTSLGYTYFNYDFDLLINPVLDSSGTGTLDLTIPGYVPDQTHYPAAFADLPIDGYMTSTYYDPNHGGEGMFVQIIDNPDGVTRTFFGAWFTYDDAGIPFWITAQGTFQIGANVVNATGYYQTDGGFAGNFGAGTTQNLWGTMQFHFPSCSTMEFTYNGSTPLVTGGPGGSGTLSWSRLADTNGLNCE